MFSFLMIRPSGTHLTPNGEPLSTQSCIDMTSNMVTTREKYKRQYKFAKPEQINSVGPTTYNDTVRVHVKNIIRNGTSVVPDITNRGERRQIVTIIGFGASGSGKTYTLMGMDSSGIKNPNGFIHGIAEDLTASSVKDISVEITQIYCDSLLVIIPTTKLKSTELIRVISSAMSEWKQQKLSTHNSSRAHLCVRIMFGGTELRIVDTAGFERASGERNRKETVHINTDMLVLKECIRGLAATPQKCIPSRQRVLTHMLFGHRDASNTIFMIGAIDPHASDSDIKRLTNIANPKHPCLAVVSNTLNYLSMIGCAEISILERKKGPSRATSTENHVKRRPRSNSLPYSPPKLNRGDNSNIKLRPIRPSQPSQPVQPSEELVRRNHRITYKIAHSDDPPNGPPNGPPSNVSAAPPPPPRTLPPAIVSYLHNQMTLIEQISSYNYTIHYRDIMISINDQQVLSSNILLEIISDICNTKEFSDEK
jgi:hypothetical protein